MIETAKMSERGQIIVPKEIRDAIGAKDGAIFAMTVQNDVIVMKKLDLAKEFRDLRAKAPKFPQASIDREIRAHRAGH
jgi:AbrB family looped-hinge helix DNA binding protein